MTLTRNAANRPDRPEGTIPLSGVLKRQAALGVPCALVIDAIASGEIGAIHVKPLSIVFPWNVFYREDDVGHWLRRQRTLSDPRAITRTDAMQLLEVNKAAIVWLVNSSWLTELGPTGRLRPIDRESLEAFQSKWVKLGELADRYGSSRRFMRSLLDQAGVAALKPPHDDERGIPAFYDRAKIAALDLATLRASALRTQPGGEDAAA